MSGHLLEVHLKGPGAGPLPTEGIKARSNPGVPHEATEGRPCWYDGTRGGGRRGGVWGRSRTGGTRKGCTQLEERKKKEATYHAADWERTKRRGKGNRSVENRLPGEGDKEAGSFVRLIIRSS